MKVIAYLLIAAGFLVGAYFSAVDADEVPWAIVVPTLLVGFVGVALAQIEMRGASRSREALRTNLEKLEQSLARIVDSAERLDREKTDVDVYSVHRLIDERFMTDLEEFIGNRESIGHAFGLQVYADVMTHFATGERYLNRCWSASTDGYIDEVHTYLTRANGQFQQALERLRAAATRTS